MAGVYCDRCASNVMLEQDGVSCSNCGARLVIRTKAAGPPPGEPAQPRKAAK